MPLFDTYVMVDWSASSEKRPSKKPKKDAIWWAAQSNGNDGGVVARLRKIRGTSDPEIVPASTGGGQVYEETRSTAIEHIRSFLLEEAQDGHRVLVGFDFAFGYPAGFARRILVEEEPKAENLWKHFHDRLMKENEDGETGSRRLRERTGGDRFQIARCMNDKIKSACDLEGPFWDVGTRVRTGDELANLPNPKGGKPPHNPYARKTKVTWPKKFGFNATRRTDTMASGAQSVWQLSGAGSVGSQVILGVPWLRHLRDSLRETGEIRESRCVIWPFDTGFQLEPLAEGPRIVFAEIYPSLLRDAIDRHREDRRIVGCPDVRENAPEYGSQRKPEIVDCAQVRLNALAFSLLDQRERLSMLFSGPKGMEGTHIGEECLQQIIREEGWILGVDQKEYYKYRLLCALKDHFFEKEERPTASEEK